MTDNHNYETPQKGATNWHEPLNDNFRKLDIDVEIRDSENQLANYVPKVGAKFVAVDSGATYFGDGSTWTKAKGSFPSVDAGNLFTKSRSTNAVVYTSAGTWFADSDIGIRSGSDGAAVLQSAIDYVASNGGGTVALVDKLDPEGSVVRCKTGVRLIGFGRMNSSANNGVGTGLVGGQSGPLVELERLSSIEGLAVVNSEDTAVRLVGRQTEIRNAWIEAKNKGITDDGNNASGAYIHDYTWITNYTGSPNQPTPAGSVGVDLTNSIDAFIKSCIVRYWETQILASGAAMDILDCDMYPGAASDGGSTVGIDVGIEADVIGNTISRHGTAVILRGNRSQVVNNRIEMVADGVGVQFDRPGGRSITSSRVSDNIFQDIDASDSAVSVDFGGASRITTSDVKDNTHLNVADRGGATRETGTVTLDGNGGRSYVITLNRILGTPDHVTVVPASRDAAVENFWVDSSSEAVVVEYVTDPPRGNGNLRFMYSAETN